MPGIRRTRRGIPIRRAAVVGAGTMGGGIAMTYANAGIPVLLEEVTQEALDHGLATSRRTTPPRSRRAADADGDGQRAWDCIEPTLDYDRFAEADIVVEAVFEDMASRSRCSPSWTRSPRPDAILATNTSTLDIDESPRRPAARST